MCGCDLDPSPCTPPSSGGCTPDGGPTDEPWCDSTTCTLRTTKTWTVCQDDPCQAKQTFKVTGCVWKTIGSGTRYCESQTVPWTYGSCSVKQASPGVDGWEVDNSCSDDPANCEGTCQRVKLVAANHCTPDGAQTQPGSCVVRQAK